jgi:hypothetical protein
VAADSTATFTIAPAPIPPDPSVITNGTEYSQTLTVTVGGTDFPISVTEGAFGVQIKLPPSITSPHRTGAQTFTGTGFLVQNFGNAVGNVTLTMENSSAALLSLNTIKAAPGFPSITTLMQRAGQGGIIGVTDYVINTGTAAKTGTATVTTSVPNTTPFCWPMPTMSVTAN